MKKLIYKFKNWLIKKLGGRTNEEVAAILREPPLIRTYNFQPIILRTETKYSKMMLSEMTIQEEFQRKLITEMIGKLSTELVDKNLVQISCMDDISSGVRTYRAELAVISPEDLRNSKFN